MVHGKVYMEKVVIITEGGKKTGFGHITRCLSLEQALEEKGIHSKFIVNDRGAAKYLLRGKDFEAFDWLTETGRLLKLICDAEVAVIDSYLASSHLYDEVSRAVKLPVYIDDNKRINYPKGLVINGTIYARGLGYPHKKGAMYLLGGKYMPLREPFWKREAKRIKDKIESVAITFGGDDSKRVTPKVLKPLAKNYPSLMKRVIIGRGFKALKSIEEIKDKKTELIYYPDAGGMKGVFLKSDIAISACGVTLYELANIGVPTIAVAVTDNQINNAREWRKAGFIEYAGRYNDKGLTRNILKKIDILSDPRERIKKREIGKALIDGKGSRRIADYIVSRLWEKE